MICYIYEGKSEDVRKEMILDFKTQSWGILTKLSSVLWGNKCQYFKWAFIFSVIMVTALLFQTTIFNRNNQEFAKKCVKLSAKVFSNRKKNDLERKSD